jgi:hypothetical protein
MLVSTVYKSASHSTTPENQHQKENFSFAALDQGPHSMFLKKEKREQGLTRH